MVIDSKSTEIRECKQNPCLNNGTCVMYGNVYKCNCLPIYRGDRCEKCICYLSNNTCSEFGDGICYGNMIFKIYSLD